MSPTCVDKYAFVLFITFSHPTLDDSVKLQTNKKILHPEMVERVGGNKSKSFHDKENTM